MNGSVDIIVPVFNTDQNRLRRCIASIRKQKYKYFRIIIVDDGSTDNETLQVLSELSHQSNIIVYHQENKGVSEARNYGLEKADADYIAFADSDDTLKENFLSDAVSTIEKTGADIVSGGIEYIKNNNVSVHTLSTRKREVTYSTDQDKKALIHNLLTNLTFREYPELRNASNGATFAKLYRSSLLRSVRFDRNITVFEDILFNVKAINAASEIVMVNDSWYQYYQYDHSAIHGFNSTLMKSYLNVLTVIRNHMQSCKEQSDDYSYFWMIYTKYLIRNYFFYTKDNIHKVQECFDNDDNSYIISRINTAYFSEFDRIILLMLKKRLYKTFCMFIRTYSLFKKI